MKNDLTKMVFRGYMTHDPSIAEELYVNRVQEEPTVLLVKPGFAIKAKHPKVLESVYGAQNIILVTHRLTKRELKTMEANKRTFEEIKRTVVEREEADPQVQAVVKLKRPSKPRVKKATCPCCAQVVPEKQFEHLRYWPGWVEGIKPDYWEALALYVYRRDTYTCKECGKTFPTEQLVCHHIISKEDGGTDSAKNLLTLCQDCHPDNKPMFSDQDND